jgi:hypothetical protein
MIAKELRIDNWVSHENRNFKIHSVSQELPCLDTTEFGIGVVTYENIYPIELSEDILIKIRFKKVDDGERLFDRYEYDDYLFFWHSTGKEIHAVGVETYNDDDKPDGLVNFAWHIKYLHSLQNLFYCLSGKELEITL